MSCVRAGEAKLRERVGDVILNAGGSNGNIDSGGPGRAALAFVAKCVGFKEKPAYLLLFAWVLRARASICCYMRGF